MAIKIAIIIQARTNSQRLPNKIIRPFYRNKSILEIIIHKLKKTGFKIYLATTDCSDDDRIKKIADQEKIECFRGDEQNVLSRFFSVSKKNKLTHAIRVCSDNPFININLLNNMVLNLEKNPSMDYIGYFDKKGKPMILSHFGFFSEIISFGAMKKTIESNIEKRYYEHVTNYTYENPDKFKILKLRANKIFDNLENIRLTVDNYLDFEIASSIFSFYDGNSDSYEELIKYIINKTDFVNQMEINIKNNKK